MSVASFDRFVSPRGVAAAILGLGAAVAITVGLVVYALIGAAQDRTRIERIESPTPAMIAARLDDAIARLSPEQARLIVRKAQRAP